MPQSYLALQLGNNFTPAYSTKFTGCVISIKTSIDILPSINQTLCDTVHI